MRSEEMLMRTLLSLAIPQLCAGAVQAGEFASYIKSVDKKREENTAKLLEARKKIVKKQKSS